MLNLPPEVRVSPLGNIMRNFLIEHDKEEPFLDFKEIIDISKGSPFAKIAKDIFAFSNYGGGFLLIGYKESPKEKDDDEKKFKKKRRNFLPVGLPDSFHIDSANLQTKFNSFSNCPLELDYQEFYRNIDGADRRFAALYIPPSTCVLKPLKRGVFTYSTGKHKGKKKTVFEPETIFFRRGTQSIVASERETKYIQQRAENHGYKLSILSGQPDNVPEKIFGNLFEVTEMPQKIYTALPRKEFFENIEFRMIPRNFVYLFWNKRIVTFANLMDDDNFINGLVYSESISCEKIQDWLNDKDKKNVLVQILNKEFSFLAHSLNLKQDFKKKRNRTIRTRKYYFPCYDEKRMETWEPRYRRISKKTVAQRIWAQQLNQFVFWHSAVKAQFMSLGNQIFLRLNPTLIVTDNGTRPIPGGTLITRLVYNRYNSNYLNSLLFWIYYLSNGSGKIVLANEKIKVSGKQIFSKMNVGIIFDRPTSEHVGEIPIEKEV